MLAQTKHSQIGKVMLLSPHSLPESASDLLEKIIAYQNTLYKLISETLMLSDKRVSISLKMFLKESKNRLRFFIMTSDEIMAQTSMFNTSKDFTFPTSVALPSQLHDFVVFNEILRSTSILYELFSQLKNKLEHSDSQVFFRDLVQKSLIFYKQTNVVLNGYLRTFKV